MTSSTPVTIVAEAAQGFEGSPALAKLLVRAASAGRADLVKFQLVYADELATEDYPYYRLFRQLEMPVAAWEEATSEAHRAGIGLVFDVYGLESLRVALKLGAAAVKIHTTDFFNETLVSASLDQAPRVFFSAGGISVDEVASFVEPLDTALAKKLTLLYGFQADPTPTADNRLARLASLRTRFPTLGMGFMDHAEGDSDEAGWLGVLALPFGITVIEKHITVDRALMLEDYVSALAPGDFARYVSRIRAAEAALGGGGLDLSSAERAYRMKALKSLVSAKPIPSGAAICADDVALLRVPLRSGQRPFERVSQALGCRALRNIKKGEPICQEDVSVR